MPKMPTDLPDHDRALVEAAVAGRGWSPIEELPTPDQLADPVFVADMPSVRASTIRALCLGLWDDVMVDPLGVRVLGARIEGQINLAFGTLRCPLSLRCCYLAEPLFALGARIPALSLVGSHLTQGLRGSGLRVYGDLICREHFRCTGEVGLQGAQIGGIADFSDAILVHAEGYAFNGDGIIVGDSLFCRGEFCLIGDASLAGARIGGLLDWRPKEWKGQLDLRHATAGQWCDSWGPSGWRSEGKPGIILDHFTYNALAAGNDMVTDSVTRVKWLLAAQKDGGFHPSPYLALAKVLRRAGDDHGAVNTLLTMARARANHQARSYRLPLRLLHRIGSGVLDLGAGYGYRPVNLAVWLMGWLIAGWMIFFAGAPTADGGPGLIKPADPVFITENQTRALENDKLTDEAKKQDPSASATRGHAIEYKLPPEYTPFNAFWYSFDTLVPLVDLGQERAWSPSPLTPKILDDVSGWLLLFYLYIHICMGWVLTTLTVGAITGVIKRDKEEE